MRGDAGRDTAWASIRNNVRLIEWFTEIVRECNEINIVFIIIIILFDFVMIILTMELSFKEKILIAQNYFVEIEIIEWCLTTT